MFFITQNLKCQNQQCCNAAMRELHMFAYVYFSIRIRGDCYIFKHNNATPSLMVVGSICGCANLGFVMFGLRLLRLGSLFGSRYIIAALVGKINATCTNHDLNNGPCTHNAIHPSGPCTPYVTPQCIAHRQVT